MHNALKWPTMVATVSYSDPCSEPHKSNMRDYSAILITLANPVTKLPIPDFF